MWKHGDQSLNSTYGCPLTSTCALTFGGHHCVPSPTSSLCHLTDRVKGSYEMPTGQATGLGSSIY